MLHFRRPSSVPVMYLIRRSAAPQVQNRPILALDTHAGPAYARTCGLRVEPHTARRPHGRARHNDAKLHRCDGGRSRGRLTRTHAQVESAQTDEPPTRAAHPARGHPGREVPRAAIRTTGPSACDAETLGDRRTTTPSLLVPDPSQPGHRDSRDDRALRARSLGSSDPRRGRERVDAGRHGLSCGATGRGSRDTRPAEEAPLGLPTARPRSVRYGSRAGDRSLRRSGIASRSARTCPDPGMSRPGAGRDR